MSLSDLVCVAKPSGLVPAEFLNDIYERKLERLRSIPWAMQVRSCAAFDASPLDFDVLARTQLNSGNNLFICGATQAYT